MEGLVNGRLHQRHQGHLDAHQHDAEVGQRPCDGHDPNLSDRLGQMRARLNAQKTDLSEALERIRLLATRDSLTGLLNRRAAQDELRRATGLAARGALPLAVTLVDLDHFKQINDCFGHLVGDGVLQAFARAAERELRSADRVTRWGAKNFCSSSQIPTANRPSSAWTGCVLHSRICT
jgi:PleD family two-component response regulator